MSKDNADDLSKLVEKIMKIIIFLYKNKLGKNFCICLKIQRCLL